MSNKATDNEQIQSSLSIAKSENNLETVSQASFSSSATNMSAKSAASARSVEKRQMREKTELAIKQLRERQRIERDAELHKLEARQALEQQGLKERLEIAKLEEEYATEAEQKLCFDEQADLNNISKASEFEYRRATLLNRDLHDSKAFDQNNNYFSGQAQGRAAPDNAMQQLAETLANLSNAPPIEIVKFTGDPKDYLRFINRFQDQVLSQPMPESKTLTRLIQYLDGRAKEAVKRYEGMGSGALTEALNVLKYRFGQSYMIVDAYIDSIVRGPIIVNGDSKGLEKLADECESLKKTLKVMYSDSEINTDHMRRIVSRLPYHNQAKCTI